MNTLTTYGDVAGDAVLAICSYLWRFSDDKLTYSLAMRRVSSCWFMCGYFDLYLSRLSLIKDNKAARGTSLLGVAAG